MSSKQHDLIEWIGIDIVGFIVLMVDLDATLKVVEIAVGVSLIIYNVVRILQMRKREKDS